MTEAAFNSIHIENHFVEKLYTPANMNLTLNEKKLILYLASLIQKDSTELEEVHIKIAELFKILNTNNSGKSKVLLEKSITSLASKVFLLYDKDKATLCRWIDFAYIDYEKNLVYIKLSETLKPFFLQLEKKARTIFQLGYILKFKKNSSIDLYLFSSRYKNLNAPIRLSVEEAIKRFGNGKYKNYCDLMRHVLLPAVEEINEKSDLTIYHSEIKSQKKYTHIIFTICKKIGSEKLSVDAWKLLNDKSKLNSAIREEFEEAIIADSIRNGYTTITSFDEPIELDLEKYIESKKHKTKIEFKSNRAKNSINYEKANQVNLQNYLRKNHRSNITYKHGTMVNAEHDSLVIFKDGFYRFSNSEAGNNVFYLMNYLNYTKKEAISSLLSFSDKDTSPVYEIEEKRFNKPFVCNDNIEEVKQYLTNKRNLNADLIEQLIEQRKIYATKRNGEVYVCFANEESNFYMLRSINETAYINKLIECEERNCFWSFSVGETRTVYLCESAIDAMSLYQLYNKAGTYVAVGGLKKKSVAKMLDCFNGFEIVMAVDNDTAGNTFASNYTYKRIKPNKKDWNEELKKESTVKI